MISSWKYIKYFIPIALEQIFYGYSLQIMGCSSLLLTLHPTFTWSFTILHTLLTGDCFCNMFQKSMFWTPPQCFFYIGFVRKIFGKCSKLCLYHLFSNIVEAPQFIGWSIWEKYEEPTCNPQGDYFYVKDSVQLPMLRFPNLWSNIYE